MVKSVGTISSREVRECFSNNTILVAWLMRRIMVADEGTKVAAVVDPQRDIQQYLNEADTQGWQIRYVFLTHFHADFVAGHLESREQTGAQICLGANAHATYPFMALEHDSVVELVMCE